MGEPADVADDEVRSQALAQGLRANLAGRSRRAHKLVAITQNMVDFRNFRTEVRAARDVEKFLEDTGLWVPTKGGA